MTLIENHESQPDEVGPVDVERLGRSMSDMIQASDLEGLLRVQAEAEAILAESRGRTRRRAKRIASEASWAIHELRRNGGETELERSRRRERVTRESGWLRVEAEAKLMGRLTALLHLLLYEGAPVASDIEQLNRLATIDAEGFLQIEIPDAVRLRSGLLLNGFEQSCRIFANAASRGKMPRVEQTLKSVAVDLVSDGAAVRGLSDDAVPLVAYGLFMGKMPFAIKSADEVAGKLDDLILSVADEISGIPVDVRAIFTQLFRLALLLGEAQTYAELHAVTTLPLA